MLSALKYRYIVKEKNFSKIFLADSQIDGRATRFNNRDQLWKNKKW